MIVSFRSCIEALIQIPLPIVTKELKRCMALLNFYRQFLPKTLEHQGQIFAVIAGSKKNDDTTLHCAVATERHFEVCKSQLANCAVLAYPLLNAELIV